MSDVVGSASVEIIPDVSGFADAISAAIGPAMDAAQSLASDFTSSFGADLSSIVDIAASAAAGVTDVFDAAFASVDAAAAMVSPVDVPVEVDTASIAPEVDAAVAAVQGESIPIAVDVQVDTGDAASQLDAVAAEATSAGSAVGGLADQTTALSTATSLAGGELNTVGGITSTVAGGMDQAFGSVQSLAGGLSDDLAPALGQAGDALKTVTAGLVAVGAFTDLVVGKATEAQSATERFNLVLGEQADVVNRVDIAGFNEDLSTMVNRLGSGTSAVRQADANIFQLGQTSGAAAEDISGTVEQVNVLATRAVALNPQLGAVGDNVDGLVKALARGGRPLANFGIALSAADINARALRDTGKSTAAELTQYEKSAAGAALATENLGDHLKTDIEAGANNVTFDFKRIQLEFNKTLVDLGKPLISPTLDLLHDALPVGIEFAKILGGVAADTLPIVSGLLRGVQPLVTIIGDKLVGALDDVQPALEEVADIIATTLADPAFAAAVGDLAGSFAELVTDLAPLLPIIVRLVANDASMASFAIAVESLAISLQMATAPLQLMLDLATSLGLITPKVVESTSKRTEAVKDETAATDEFVASAKALSDAVLQHIADINQMNEADRVGADGFAFLGLNINELRNLSDKELDAVGKTLGLNEKDFEGWAKSVMSFVDDVAKGAAAQLPKISDAFTFDGGKQLFDPATIELQLKNQAQAVNNFQGNLEQLSARGLDNLVNELLRQGPMVGGALAASLIAGGPDRAAALNDQLATTQQAFNQLTDWVTNVFGPKFAAESGYAARTAGDDFSIAILASVPEAERAGMALGDALTRGLHNAHILDGAEAAGAAIAASVNLGFEGGFTNLGGTGGLAAGLLGAGAAAVGVPLGAGVGASSDQVGGASFSFDVTVNPPVGMSDGEARRIGEQITDGAMEQAQRRMEIRAKIFAS